MSYHRNQQAMERVLESVKIQLLWILWIYCLLRVSRFFGGIRQTETGQAKFGRIGKEKLGTSPGMTSSQAIEQITPLSWKMLFNCTKWLAIFQLDCLKDHIARCLYKTQTNQILSSIDVCLTHNQETGSLLITKSSMTINLERMWIIDWEVNTYSANQNKGRSWIYIFLFRRISAVTDTLDEARLDSHRCW